MLKKLLITSGLAGSMLVSACATPGYGPIKAPPTAHTIKEAETFPWPKDDEGILVSHKPIFDEVTGQMKPERPYTLGERLALGQIEERCANDIKFRIGDAGVERFKMMFNMGLKQAAGTMIGTALSVANPTWGIIRAVTGPTGGAALGGGSASADITLKIILDSAYAECVMLGVAGARYQTVGGYPSALGDIIVTPIPLLTSTGLPVLKAGKMYDEKGYTIDVPPLPDKKAENTAVDSSTEAQRKQRQEEEEAAIAGASIFAGH